MSEWLTKELEEKAKQAREEKGHIGMKLTHDKKGNLLKWNLRYKKMEVTK